MRDDLGVGFGHKLVALRGEFALQLQIILDNAVMHNDDPPRAIPMRVRVLFRGPSVRGPAGVPDAEAAINGLLAQNLFQVT